MLKKSFITFMVATFAFLTMIQPSFANPSPVNEQLVPHEGVLWGSSKFENDQEIQDRMGRPFDVYHIFHDWKKPFPTDKEKQIAEKGSILYFTWAPLDYDTRENYSWKSIASGQHDETIDQAAKRFKQFGKKVFLSFHHEMDAKKGDSQNPEDYVAAYRRVHERFQQQGATNVVWVWTVTGAPSNFHKLDKLYPGDTIVDWVAWDPYNWAHCRERQQEWREFAEVVNEAYGYMNEHYGNKPFMLAEYGTVEKPNEPKGKGDWMRQIPNTLKQYPNLKAVVYFNYVVPSQRKCDWRLATSEESLKGFVEASKDPYVNIFQR